MHKIKTVYLAGGMRSGWQEKVTSEAPGFTYIDPRTHGLTNPPEYAKWDLEAVDKCDIVFAFMENGNPSGLGMAFECGYALAKGKRLIFVNENERQQRYGAIIGVSAEATFTKLDDGIAYLLSVDSERGSYD